MTKTKSSERTYTALLLPWDEPASQFHGEHPRQVYRRGEVHQPKGDLKLRENHDGHTIGVVSSFVSTTAGIEAVVKLGLRGEELLEQGHVGLSAEVDEDSSDLIGVALCVDEEPAFRSACIIVDDTPIESLGGYGHMTPVTVGPSSAWATAPTGRSMMDLGEAKEFAAALSMQSVHAEVARVRKFWEERVASLPDLEIADQEQRLIAAGIPMQSWPTPRGRQVRESVQARQVELDGEIAARDFAERMERLQQRAEAVHADGVVAALAFTRRMARLEGDAERERLPWYRRLFR